MKLKLHTEYFAITLFFVALALYINIDQIPLSHPGNIKAADPFYHTIEAEFIQETGEWNYYPDWLSQHQQHMMNIQPPLLYMDTVALSLFGDLPVWAVMYFLTCIAAALSLLFLYLACAEVFEHKMVGVIAVAFAVLPLSLEAWLYGLTIGFWIQVVGYMFVMAYFWLFIKQWKQHANWHLVLIGVLIAALLLVHPQDLVVLAFPTALLIAKRWHETKMWQSTLHTFSVLCAIPFLVFLFLLPRFLHVWNKLGGQGYFIMYKGFNDIFSKANLGGFPTPDLTFFLKVVLIAAMIGLLILLRNWKQYKLWLASTAYFFFMTYGIPVFLASPHYLLRMRALSPFFILPPLAYFLNSLFVNHLANKTNLPRMLFAAVICIAAIAWPVQDYRQLTSNAHTSEHITSDVWDVFEWMHANTNPSSTILVLEGGYQESALYLKRTAATVPLEELQKKYDQYAKSNPAVFDPAVHVEWTGRTLRDAETVQDSLFKYHSVKEWGADVRMEDFDYIILMNIPNALIPYNNFVMESLTKEGYAVAYTHGPIGVLQRGASA